MSGSGIGLKRGFPTLFFVCVILRLRHGASWRLLGVREGVKMTGLAAKRMREEPRFCGLEKFEKKIWRMAGNAESRLEEQAAGYAGVRHAVALSCGTAAVHLAVRLAAERLYGSRSGVSTPAGVGAGGSLFGKRAFCPALAPAAAISPIVYEGGEPVFIDASPDDWGMDPQALELAFQKYPDVRLVTFAHLYGFPGQIDKVKRICEKHDALLIEDAAESLGAKYNGKPVGSFGDYGTISFRGDGFAAGSGGGALLANDAHSAAKARKWAAQSLEDVRWNQHEELGYNYRISEAVADAALARLSSLEERIAQKKRIYDRYADRLEPLGVELNPYDGMVSEPSYRRSCMRLDENSLCAMERSDKSYTYRDEHGRTCPMEILEALEAFCVEGDSIWKPMHTQPMYRNHDFISVDGGRRTCIDRYSQKFGRVDESVDLFEKGVCLPSDVEMTQEEQERVIEIIYACFCGREFGGRYVYDH